MEIQLDQDLVLRSAGTIVSTYSRPFQIPPEHGFDAEAVVTTMTGANAQLGIAAEMTNDDEKWIEVGKLCHIAAPGLTVAPVWSFPSARCRLRYDFSGAAPGGTCVVSATIRTKRRYQFAAPSILSGRACVSIKGAGCTMEAWFAMAEL